MLILILDFLFENAQKDEKTLTQAMDGLDFRIETVKIVTDEISLLKKLLSKELLHFFDLVLLPWEGLGAEIICPHSYNQA